MVMYYENTCLVILERSDNFDQNFHFLIYHIMWQFSDILDLYNNYFKNIASTNSRYSKIYRSYNVVIEGQIEKVTKFLRSN